MSETPWDQEARKRFESVTWEIGNDGRPWNHEEIKTKYHPVFDEIKLELHQGKLFYSDWTRKAMLASMLEFLGADTAVELGDLEIWEQAIAKRQAQEQPQN